MKSLSPMLAWCLLFLLVLFVSLKDVEAAHPMRRNNGKVRKTQVRVEIAPEKHNVEVSLDKKDLITSLLKWPNGA